MYNGFSAAYTHTLANRRYGTQADDLYDQNFVEIKGSTTEGSLQAHGANLSIIHCALGCSR